MEGIKNKPIRSKKDITSLIKGEIVKIGIAYPVARWHVYEGKNSDKYSFIASISENKILQLEIGLKDMYVRDGVIFIRLRDYNCREYESYSQGFADKRKMLEEASIGE